VPASAPKTRSARTARHQQQQAALAAAKQEQQQQQQQQQVVLGATPLMMSWQQPWLRQQLLAQGGWDAPGLPQTDNNMDALSSLPCWGLRPAVVVLFTDGLREGELSYV